MSKIAGSRKNPIIIPKIMMVKLYCSISFEMGKIEPRICNATCFMIKMAKTPPTQPNKFRIGAEKKAIL